MKKILSSALILQVVSADIPRIVTCLIDAGVDLRDICHIDPVTAQLCISRRDYMVFQAVLDQHGVEHKIIRKVGLYWKLQKIFKRPIPVLAAVTVLCLTIFLSSRIYFVRVEGNVNIPERYILEKAELVGIGFGTSRVQIRSERVKNALLSEIPQLQWVGVNTNGCIATISVREKSLAKEDEVMAGISGIVAIRDGIIKSCTVYKGNALCNVGQAVKKGDLLVSGYTDCGLYTQAQRAEAEITALTGRTIHGVTPTSCAKRQTITDTHTCLGLRIGKKLIKFCNHSGIYDDTCVKMYWEECWTLPGGFRLPVAWVQETVEIYETQSVVTDEPEEYKWINLEAERYLFSQMIAGQVLSADFKTDMLNGIYVFNGDYSCLEVIGQERYEEILE